MLANLTEKDLVELACKNKEGRLTSDGVLSINTGTHTGRCPHAKAIVEDEHTADWVDWSNNQKISPTEFSDLHKKILKYFLNNNKNHYVQTVYANHDASTRLDIEIHTSTAWQSHYARNMFNTPKANQMITPEWKLYSAPEFSVIPRVLISFEKKVILIVGTHYGGEIKKSVFTALNFLLPLKGILPMHCAVNTNSVDTTPAIFFGLSGTGKTTLSSDTNRILIGDDEHCWSNDGLFNFEGGCYAKTYMLSKEDEPDIWLACHKKNAILENVVLDIDGTPDFRDNTLTENGRVSYPISHVAYADPIGSCDHPKNIIMLTCDAFGVLPPISLLNKTEAIKHFLLGYTAKIPGTEVGIAEPITTFSHCYGGPFMPHRPTVYSNLLFEKIKTHKVKCWLINTGWTGGPYGTGHRMPISVTRSIIQAIHNGSLEKEDVIQHEYTKLKIPRTVSGVKNHLLSPETTWANIDSYKKSVQVLLRKFDAQYRKMNIAL
jgi:phosphoenolpyruvate carboxykinase (ATP)